MFDIPRRASQARTSHALWRAVALRFVLMFAPLLLASGAVVGGLYWFRERNERALLEQNEEDRVKLLHEIIAADFQSVVSDLLILTQGRALEELLEHPGPQARQVLAREYQLFAERKQLYDQVRYLDANGMEVVRVNYSAGRADVAPESQLQSKADYDYVKQAKTLRPGDVFVSRLDLNVENRQIEVPYKPTIRFVTTVTDKPGTLRGFVVLNYLGRKLLEKLTLHGVGQAQLLNKEGYWLAGPTAEKEWGWMFQRQELSFAHELPDEWGLLLGAEAGQFHTAKGLYTFHTVYPLRNLQTDSAEERVPGWLRNDYRWKLLSHVSQERLAAESRELWALSRYAWLALALVLGVVSWLFARLSVNHQRAREQFLQRERLAAIGEAMTALAHESRNALQRSQSGLEMLKKRVKDNAETVELVNEVQEAQVYLTDLYEEVRGYAAPANLRRKPLDLRELVQKTWSELTGAGRNTTASLVEQGIEAARARPDGQTPPGLPDTCCEADPRAIGQVLRNLLENALAAADPARVEITWADARMGGQPALRLAIRDNGPGVLPEDRERIFEPFFTTKVRGTGLGLAISRRLVTAHGGQLVVADGDRRGAAGSKSDGRAHGAEFWITLPRGAS